MRVCVCKSRWRMAVKFVEGVLAGPHADFLARPWGRQSLWKAALSLLWALALSSRVNTGYSRERERERRDDRRGHGKDIGWWWREEEVEEEEKSWKRGLCVCPLEQPGSPIPLQNPFPTRVPQPPHCIRKPPFEEACVSGRVWGATWVEAGGCGSCPMVEVAKVGGIWSKEVYVFQHLHAPRLGSHGSEPTFHPAPTDWSLARSDLRKIANRLSLLLRNQSQQSMGEYQSGAAQDGWLCYRAENRIVSYFIFWESNRMCVCVCVRTHFVWLPLRLVVT